MAAAAVVEAAAVEAAAVEAAADALQILRLSKVLQISKETEVQRRVDRFYKYPAGRGQH